MSRKIVASGALAALIAGSYAYWNDSAGITAQEKSRSAQSAGVAAVAAHADRTGGSESFAAPSAQLPEMQTDVVTAINIDRPLVEPVYDAGEDAQVPDASEIFSPERAYRSGNFFKVKASRSSDVSLVDANVAQQFVMKNGNVLLQLGEHDGLAFRESRRDQLGNVYYKYGQTYENIPVFGREIVVTTQTDSQFKVAMGEFESGIEISTAAGISGGEALASGLASLPEPMLDQPVVHVQPSLEIYVDEQVAPVLTYRTIVEYDTATSGHRVDEVFIDAGSGELVQVIPKLHMALQRNIHTYQDQCLSGWNDNLPGVKIQDPANGDEHASGAYHNTGSSYWFFHHMFGRDSFDAQGIDITATVHARFQGSNGCSGDNAMFDTNKKQLIFGAGGSRLSNPAGALDIVGHELAHGVTASENNLTYRNESGALNEAFSDIFGSGVDAWVDSGGSSAGNPADGLQPNENTWTIGEDAALDTSFKRIMNNPTADGHSRDDYADRYTGSDDNGGVHSNSGIANLAFYLLSEGGVHPDSSVSTNTVNGIGMEKALNIYYHSAVNLFTSSTNFEGARMKLAESAQTLHGECSDEWHAVHQSFDAVNVPGSWESCNHGDDSGGDSGGDTGGDNGGDSGDENGGDTGSGSGGGTSGGVAATVSAEASTSYSANYAAANAIDGNSSTLWVSTNVYNQYRWEWLQVELDDVSDLTGIDIDWNGYDYARSIVIEVSADGSNWTNAGSGGQYAPGTTHIDVSASARFVRVWMRGGNYGRWYAIRELKLQ